LPNCVVETGIKNAKGPQVEYVKSLIAKAKQQTGWVIIVFHHILPDGTQKNDEARRLHRGSSTPSLRAGRSRGDRRRGRRDDPPLSSGRATDVTNP